LRRPYKSRAHRFIATKHHGRSTNTNAQKSAATRSRPCRSSPDKPLRRVPGVRQAPAEAAGVGPLFRLAGSGWYETDFKSDRERKRNISEKGDKEPPPPPRTSSPPRPVEGGDQGRMPAAPREGRVPWRRSRPEGGRGAAPAARRKSPTRPRGRSAEDFYKCLIRGAKIATLRVPAPLADRKDRRCRGRRDGQSIKAPAIYNCDRGLRACDL